MDIKNIEQSFRQTDDKKCAVSKKGMVSSAFPDATKAGAEMLKKGGNAIDAACAVALALGVCEPQASGIGGQSMAILHIKGKSVAVDGSSRAPSMAHSSAYNVKTRNVGYKAATIPSTLSTIGFLHERYGSLEWQTIVEPSIRIAKQGYKITKLQHYLQTREAEGLLSTKSGAKYFLKDGTVPFEIGDRFIQDDLAHTLTEISDSYHVFYRGSIAKKIDLDMKNNHGLIRQEDLAYIPEPIEKKPISRGYRDVSIVTMPPPAAGTTLLLTLMMLDHMPSEFLHGTDPKSYHYTAETFRKAFLHRVQHPFNRHTYDQIQNKAHLHRSFAKRLAESIRNSIDHTLPIIDPPFGGEDTTHLSVMDEEGNAVGITQSIELAYGSKAAAEGLGFLYNNYISAFEFENPNHPYYIRPNAIPWTSVSPALVFCNKKLWMVIGSPGSQRIFSTIAQFISGMIDGNLSMYDAVTRPRFHCNIDGTVSIEQGGFGNEIIEYLKGMGYEISIKNRYSFYHGAIHAVMKLQTLSGFHGVAEVRRDGTAEGVN